MFTRAAAGAANTRGTPRPRQGHPHRPAEEPRARPARGARRAAGRVPRRGDRDAGRRARSARSSPSPATRSLSTPERRPARARARVARLHGEPRHLPERDDAARARHPAGPLAARAAALRRRALAARDPQLRALVGARLRAAGRPSRGLGDRAARSPASSPGQGPAGRRRARWTTSSRCSSIEVGAAAGGLGRDADGCMAALAPRRGPERLARPACCGRGPTATASARSPTASSLARARGQPARRRPRRARSRASPRCCARRPGMIELAPDADRRRRAAPARAARARPTRRSASSAGATSAPTTRGCTTSRTWCAGGERCTLQVHPDDARRLGLADGARARVRSRAGAIEVPVEVTDAIMPGVVSLPHGWGHDAPGTQLASPRARRRQQQPARGRREHRSAVGQLGAERDPGDGRAGKLSPQHRRQRRCG